MVRYGPANNTDRWQPIDCGYGHLIKEKVKAQYTTWWNEYVKSFSGILLNVYRNHKKFAKDKVPDASHRRILITKWVGQAAEEVAKACDIQSFFYKTGCLISLSGLHDNSIIQNIYK